MILPTGSTPIAIDRPQVSRHMMMRHGFTLLEMITVMVMLSAIVALSAPSLRNFFKSRKLTEESRRLLALTEFGRREAVSSGVPIRILIDLQLRVIRIQREDGYPAQEMRLPGPLEISEKIHMDFGRIPPLLGQTYALTFLPDGTIPDTNPTQWRIFQTDDEDNFYTIGQLMGHLDYRLFSPNDPQLQYIRQFEEASAQSGRVYLR